MKLFSFETKSGKLPRWGDWTGSLSCSQMLRTRTVSLMPKSTLSKAEVDCMTVQQLFQRCTIKDPDILLIDAEGLDYQILSQFDLKGLNTKLIIFETESMGEAEQTACLKQIEEADFTWCRAGLPLLPSDVLTPTWRSGRRQARLPYPLHEVQMPNGRFPEDRSLLRRRAPLSIREASRMTCPYPLDDARSYHRAFPTPRCSH